MRAIIQRVNTAKVTVNDKLISSIGKGLCVLIGIHKNDTPDDIEYIVRKILDVPFFASHNQRWKKNVTHEKLEILCVSQFTLFATLKDNLPEFGDSMGRDLAKPFYEKFLESMKEAYDPEKVKDGEFGKLMKVHIENDGPVTIILDSRDKI